MRQAREHVAAEIAPFLRELIMRAEEVLARDEREARALRNKVCICHLPWATEELSKNESKSQLIPRVQMTNSNRLRWQHL